jgi:hypothetical protein
LWPDLPLAAWQETLATIHRWTQIIGKIRLELSPMVNHWWQVALYVTSSGLTTSPIPYDSRVFQIDLDFIAHRMAVTLDGGEQKSVALKPQSVAEFYRQTFAALGSLGIEATIWTTPVEIADRTPFERDEKHASYDPEYAHRLFRVLLQVDRILKKFRSRFIGKASPAHFFWGAFDMAATRFSGRTAPKHPGFPNVARFVMVEAYSHEVSSCGFWPGDGLSMPAFYAYAYPEPARFKEYPIKPKEAFYSDKMGEFILPYDAVRASESPDEKALAFLQSAYEAAADLAKWDRASLERDYVDFKKR